MSHRYPEQYFSAFTAKNLGDDAMLRDIVVLVACDCDLSERCRILYDGRNTLWQSNDGRFCVKFYREPARIKGFIYRWLRMPKARRAWENAHRLIRLGFDTPLPKASCSCSAATGSKSRATSAACTASPGHTSAA